MMDKEEGGVNSSYKGRETMWTGLPEAFGQDFVCSTCERLPHTYEKEDAKLQYSGGAIFVDYTTGFIYIKHQVVNLDSHHSTIEAKEAFKAFCCDYGIVVSEYLSNNCSAYTADAYHQHLESFLQISPFAGVDAHHHIGVLAEQSIQTIVSMAHTMLLHSAIHWPDVADASLWSLAVDHAVKLYNYMPNPSTGLSPHDLLSKT
jgi:hypothetical protein